MEHQYIDDMQYLEEELVFDPNEFPGVGQEVDRDPNLPNLLFAANDEEYNDPIRADGVDGDNGPFHGVDDPIREDDDPVRHEDDDPVRHEDKDEEDDEDADLGVEHGKTIIKKNNFEVILNEFLFFR